MEDFFTWLLDHTIIHGLVIYNWSLGHTIIFGIVIYNWLFVAGGIVILLMLYRSIMGLSKE
jgi:hypothetical protein